MIELTIGKQKTMKLTPAVFTGIFFEVFNGKEPTQNQFDEVVKQIETAYNKYS